MQGFDCALQPNKKVYKKKRELWHVPVSLTVTAGSGGSPLYFFDHWMSSEAANQEILQDVVSYLLEATTDRVNIAVFSLSHAGCSDFLTTLLIPMGKKRTTCNYERHLRILY